MIRGMIALDSDCVTCTSAARIVYRYLFTGFRFSAFRVWVRPAAALGITAAIFAMGCGKSPGETAPPLVSTPAIEPAVPPGSVPPATDPPRRTRTAPLEITFDDIKLDMGKGAPFFTDLLPKRVTALAGESIRIRGYILPSFQQRGLTQFVLVRDNQECCFGPGAALHDCIVVRMRPGATADFSIRPVAVAGTFRIDELTAPDGTHLAIYAMDGDEVQ